MGRRPHFLQQNLLASFDEKLSILDWCIRQYAMTEIENVPAPGQRVDRILRNFPDLRWRTEQYSRINISLQSDFRTEHPANFRQVHTPIHAQNIGPRARHG